MAARKLAEVGGASLVQASDKDLTPMSMLRDITPEERMEVLTEIRKRNNHISEIVNYVKTSEGKIDFEKLKKLNEGPAIRENWENDFKDKEIKALEDYLKNTSEAAETLYKNYEKNK